MDIYQDVDAFAISQTTKADQSPLTKADLIANHILVKGLRAYWPTIPILSEEGADSFGINQEYEYYWAVDPLDGTKEFIKRNGEFTVNVALIYLGNPILGVVFAPALDNLYVGCVKSKIVSILDTPYAKKLSHGQWQQIAVASEYLSSLNRLVRIVASRSHSSAQLQSWIKQYPNHELLEVGSSLKFCYVAEGKADLYPRLGPTCIWDTAAGHAVVLAAGGVVMDMNDQGLKYLRPEQVINPNFLASST